MRLIQLNQRGARLLRDNLTNNQDGYDYTDLCRLDFLAKKLTTLQGKYGERMAELARDERTIQRKRAKDALTDLETNKAMLAISYEVEDLNEEAEKVEVTFEVEDGDYRLIADKLNAVNKWIGVDGLRSTIIGMVEAVQNAELKTDDNHTEEPRKLRRV